MEVEKMSTATKTSPEDGDVPLPGFRFNPTDEELLTFYLRRKVEKKPLKPEIIKQADIYKHDPWDLPCNSTGEREWYFFCKRGRKYRNSIRPNRVTGSGFWKATGIDRPVIGCGGQIVGLKKSLVYYLGNAGKGTKTEWMMHEYRLPPPPSSADRKSIADEAEVWTLCRLLRRNVSRSKSLPEWKTTSSSSKMASVFNSEINRSCGSDSISIGSSDQNTGQSRYISFSAQNEQKKPHSDRLTGDVGPQLFWGHFSPPAAVTQQPPPPSPPQFDGDISDLLGYADWEDLHAIVNSGFPWTNPPRNV